MIYLRKAQLSDLTAIMKIIQEAKIFLGQSGSDQWQGAYPAVSDIENDLAKAQGYVLIVGQKVAGYSAIITGEEPAYTAITEGSWLNDSLDYVTIHRIALSDEFRGQHLTQFLFSNIFSLLMSQGYRDFRLDTHELNRLMQYVFEREGFVRRGNVIVDGPRIGYQLLL